MQDEQRPDEEWLTVEQVAAALSIKPGTVAKMLREGRLWGRKLDPTREKSPWLVPRAEVGRYIQAMEKRADAQRAKEYVAVAGYNDFLEQMRASNNPPRIKDHFADRLRQEARDATQERIASSLERIAVALERATPSLTLDHIVPRTWEANHHGC